MKDFFPIGSLVRYRTIKDPYKYTLKNNTMFLYGIIINIDPRSKEEDSYYRIFWITKHHSGAIFSSIFCNAPGLKLVSEAKGY